MINIEAVFNLYNARSAAFERHDEGGIPFISSGFFNNGVVGFVKPYKGDKVFDREMICVSAFCEATVQEPPFIARGNGGSGMTVLEPKSEMSYEAMLFYAAAINKQLKWRFSFGRMVTIDRLKGLSVAEYQKIDINVDLQNRLPSNSGNSRLKMKNILTKKYRVDMLFDLGRGDFHSMKILKSGEWPVVSRSVANNGVVGHFSIPKGASLRKAPAITVSTTTGDAFVQLEDFLPTDNVVICHPKKSMKLSTLFYLASAINQEKWRYSYGRQCYKEKFSKTEITVFVDDKGEIDEESILKSISTMPYWNTIFLSQAESFRSSSFVTLDKY